MESNGNSKSGLLTAGGILSIIGGVLELIGGGVVYYRRPILVYSGYSVVPR